jgi:hypothetical protein
MLLGAFTAKSVPERYLMKMRFLRFDTSAVGWHRSASLLREDAGADASGREFE